MRQAVLLAGALLIASAAAAMAQDINVVDEVVGRFQTVTNGWEGRLQQFAQGTFALLATIQLFWAMAKLVFRRADFTEFVAELVNQIMFIGLFFWLLTTTTTWGPAIINSFREAGAVGGSPVLAPGDVLKVGIDVSGQVWDQMKFWSPASSAAFAIASIVVMLCFAWIALTMVVALVESYFVISGGVLMMAFGASVWTRDVAISVVRNVFGIGAKLFALQLIMSVGATFIQQWSAQFNDMTSRGLFIEIAQALLLAGIVKTIPDLFQRIVGGIGTANGGALIGAAAGLASAAVLLSTASMKLATSIAGTGAATGAGAALASGQMSARVAAGTAPATAVGRGAAMLGQTAKNVGSAVGQDIGRRLSGQGGRFGSTPFRVAASLNERSRLLDEEQNAPTTRPR